MAFDDEEVTREQLYNLVWSEPMLRVAERFKVSSSYMARVCAALGVPRPPRGYWASLESGKSLKKPALPFKLPRQQDSWRPGSALSVELLTSTKTAAKDLGDASSEPKVSTVTHRLLRGARPLFLKGWKPGWESEVHLKPHKRNLPHVITSETGLDEALDIANKLFRCLEAKGHVVVLGRHLSSEWPKIETRETPDKTNPYNRLWTPGRATVANFGSIPIGLAIIEVTEHLDAVHFDGKYLRNSEFQKIDIRQRNRVHWWKTTHTFPSGRFKVLAYLPDHDTNWALEWQQEKGKSFMPVIRKIVEDLEAAMDSLAVLVQEMQQKRAKAAAEWEEKQQRWRVEEEQKKKDWAILESKKALLVAIVKWSEIKAQHEFLDSVAKSCLELPEDQRIGVEERINLARALLGKNDALNEILGWQSPDDIIEAGKRHPAWPYV